MVRTMALYLYALGLVLPPVAASEDCCCSRFRGEPTCGRSRRSRGPHERVGRRKNPRELFSQQRDNVLRVALHPDKPRGHLFH